MFSQEEAAKVARTLIQRESLANVNTIYPESSPHAGVPVSFVEYYADCHHDGNPVMIVVDIGTTFRNEAKGSPLSLSVRTGDHQGNDLVNPSYPGGIIGSTAGSPRVNLRGKLHHYAKDELSEEEVQSLEQCFVKRHKDAKWWFPREGNQVHTTHWGKFMVEDVYMVGGFGDRAYIGDIDGELYRAAEEALID
ncbi:hypothetical protein BABINDRAFT_170599 [Babjeviella inositovora NRRL Y-12698]|uniref:CREG-like beta-barrel domain-containing protein n=1 Tax=Babjeviella inositovora NRRL Y-12698 TaxID=984486 RepID=A0A1E3QWI2_9ASCO|nr:uncharacterized protein BABINDRAFT_170599 [Babjeviella inositovora NRRL Y-12698]ODQ82049.1 hypothetical protein BABINDRAFT_170599 [Babjeviella inositovora NRRL Y-12698]